MSVLRLLPPVSFLTLPFIAVPALGLWMIDFTYIFTPSFHIHTPNNSSARHDHPRWWRAEGFIHIRVLVYQSLGRVSVYRYTEVLIT
jgi:hypothetical protein